MDDTVIKSADVLRSRYGEPSERAVKKQLDRLDRHCRRFIELSPFLVIATAGADGLADASPRGDAPGFVAVLDDRRLLIPDRLGNNRVDTLGNVTETGAVGLLFLIPGVNETLRVNGRGRITVDADLLEPLSANGKAPLSGLLVAVEEAFLQCAKALIRSDLWNPDKRVDRSVLPSMGRMLADQIDGLDPEEAERLSEQSIRERLY